jgi:HK97 family phage portal protein
VNLIPRAAARAAAELKAWFWSRPHDPYRHASIGGVYYLGEDLEAGVLVDRESAMELSAVAACIDILAADVGQIPVDLYQRADSGRVKARWAKEYALLKAGPNAYQTWQEYAEQVMVQLLTAGNHYARIGRVNGYVAQLFPIEDPEDVETSLSAGRKVHKYDGRTWMQGDIFHIHAPSPDGYCGRLMTDTHRQTLSLARALYRYGSRWFANGGQPRGYLILPPGTKQADVDSAVTNWESKYGGTGAHKVAAYPAGVEWKPISANPEESQALDSRSQVNKEIASLMGVPHWRLYQDVPVELEAWRGYYTQTLRPWITRITAALNKQVVGGFPEFYAEANFAAMLQADIQTRAEAYRTMIEARVLNPNEARERENMNAYPGGEKYVNPNTTAMTLDGNDGGGDA